ncbi:MAG: GNAT family N-acetyltransferase, partial [Clostridia bacterium]|nr:GNAT family N-acetyltransferase [Clostridia bacterium]
MNEKLEKEIISIQISKYLTNDIAKKIALGQWHSKAPEWVNRIRHFIFSDDYFYDCFSVVAGDQNDNVVGRLYCVQNGQDKALWDYGDLFVAKEYRRMGIASSMIKAAINHLLELNAKILRCYVDPDNYASISLQKSMGFCEKAYEPFNELINDGDLMFEIELKDNINVIPATADEVQFVAMIHTQKNENALHVGDISFDDFKTMLSSENIDEQNFLVCRGCMPVTWLKISGLLGNNTAWISMLVVNDKYHHQGLGTFAVNFAEKYVVERG